MDKFYPLFNLNLDSQNPNIHLIENVIKEYHKALGTVILWGPTHFGNILKVTNNIVKQENDKLKYNILMILTDGKLEDPEETINELVEGSFLPLSVIIIGIGNDDFTKMNVLNAEKNPLISKSESGPREILFNLCVF